MAIEEITISSLKQTKNAIIGNPTAKRTLAQDEAFVDRLVTFLYKSDERVITTSENEDELRVEAAHILASLSYGSAETLRPLLKTDALPAMVLALSNYGPPSTPAVKIALARVLKTLGAALVDVVGPPQWGLHANYPEIQEDAKTTLDKLVTIDAFDICLPLLASPSSQLSMAIAQLLASTLRLQTHRVVASEWVPPSERNKEIKGKRGWEKTEASSSPSKDGGWLARQLVLLIQKKDAKLQEAALSALASLTRDNPSVATGLTRSTPDHNSILNMVLSSCKSRNTNLQLAACLCASNIFRASFTPHSLVMDQSAPMTVIHVMNGLLEAENESPQTRMKACYILYYLVADEKDLCQLAYERGSLTKLAQLVKSITPSDISTLPNWDEDEPDSLSALRAAALTAIASISLFDTDIRGEVSGNLKLIPYIQVCLFHRHVGVRYAACQCVRALSRAVAVLRTNLVDSGLGLSVYQVFCREDEDARVTHAAASVICNIISDFSPLQSTLLEQGVIERLVRLLQSGESTLMLDALWAFKNILYKSNLDVKRRVMHALCWSTVASLLNHENTGFQEQTFHILRNLADTQEGVDMIFDELSSDFLLSSLSRALESDNDDVLRQAVYLTGNLSNSAAHSREILSHAKILQSLRVCLSDAKVDVRRPAVVCICELIRANPRSYKEFRDSGIESTLRHICDYGGGFMSSSPTSTRFHHHHSHHIGVEDDREVKSKAKEALDLLQCAFPEME